VLYFIANGHLVASGFNSRESLRVVRKSPCALSGMGMSRIEAENKLTIRLSKRKKLLAVLGETANFLSSLIGEQQSPSPGTDSPSAAEAD
jgi:hypothetical protein